MQNVFSSSSNEQKNKSLSKKIGRKFFNGILAALPASRSFIEAINCTVIFFAARADFLLGGKGTVWGFEIRIF